MYVQTYICALAPHTSTSVFFKIKFYFFFFYLLLFTKKIQSSKTLHEMHNNPFFYRQGHPACVGTLVSGVLISGILVLGN